MGFEVGEARGKEEGRKAGEEEALMAEFLHDTFEPNVAGCGHHQHQSVESAFGDALDASEMDASETECQRDGC